MNNILKGAFLFGLLLLPFGNVDAQSIATSTDKLKIVSPVVGTKIKPGETIKISLAREGRIVTAPVSLKLVPTDPSRKDLPIQAIMVGTKSSNINWKVPTNVKEGLYSIVASTYGVKNTDYLNVEIFVPKTITLVTPNGGEKLKVGDTLQIRWKTNLPTMTPIYFEIFDTRFTGDTSEANGSVPGVQVKIPNTGVYSWKIPTSLNEGLMKLGSGNVYKLRVIATSSNDSIVEDYSNAVFSIIDPTGTGTTTATTTPPVANPSLFVSQLAQPILSNTHILSIADGARDIAFNGFSAKSEGAASTIKDVSVKINRVGSSSLPSTVYLWDRAGTLYASKAVLSDGVITFNNNAIQIPKDKAIELIVKGDVPSTAISGSRISVDITNVVTASGTTTKTALPLAGNTMTFINSSNSMGLATYQSTAQPSIVTVGGTAQTGRTSQVVATFPLQVTAVGGNIPAPKSSDFNAIFVVGSTTIPATSVSVVTIPNNMNGVAEGSISSVTVTAVLSGNQLKSGLYYAKLANLKTANGYTDIFTPYSTPVVASSRRNIGMLTASVAQGFRTVFGSMFGIFGF